MKRIFSYTRVLVVVTATIVITLQAVAAPLKLVLALSSDWSLQISEVKNNAMYQQRVQRRDGKEIQHLQLTAFQPAREAKAATVGDPEIKKLAESQRDSVLKKSTDKTIAVQKLSSGRGYYFVAHDANTKPRPDEYPQLVQGVMLVDRTLVNFTLLTHDAASADAKAALVALDRVSLQ